MLNLSQPFSNDEARLCMRLSDWAYLDSDDDTLKDGLTENGLTFVDSLSEKTGEGSIFGTFKVDTQAFCADRGDTRYIAFRGSEPGFWDWLTDFRIDTESVDGGHNIHRGFLHALSTAGTKATLASWGKDAGAKRIVLTGHSLGGALAAAFAVLSPKPLAACYTYGQPRIGIIESAPATPICRFVNQADIVPRVPVDFAKFVRDSADSPGLRLLAEKLIKLIKGKLIVDIEYRHIGNVWVIKQNGQFEENGETEYLSFLKAKIPASLDELIASRLPGQTFDYQGDLISDHTRKRYLKALGA